MKYKSKFQERKPVVNFDWTSNNLIKKYVAKQVITKQLKTRDLEQASVLTINIYKEGAQNILAQPTSKNVAK